MTFTVGRLACRVRVFEITLWIVRKGISKSQKLLEPERGLIRIGQEVKLKAFSSNKEL